MRIVEQQMSVTKFNDTYGPAAWAVATQENAGGCFDVHP